MKYIILCSKEYSCTQTPYFSFIYIFFSFLTLFIIHQTPIFYPNCTPLTLYLFSNLFLLVCNIFPLLFFSTLLYYLKFETELILFKVLNSFGNPNSEIETHLEQCFTVIFHISGRGERNIFYKDVKTSHYH